MEIDFDAMLEAGDLYRKARREGTIADQRISPVYAEGEIHAMELAAVGVPAIAIVHSNCDPGDSMPCQCGDLTA